MKKRGGRAIVIFIVGPTAAGKTRVSIKLASRLNGEIISCDSMQVYKGMAVLSQAPDKSDRDKIKHYLIGVLDPRKEYNVAEFRVKAQKIIGGIIKRGKIPIVVGGSGLYVKALVDGLFPSPGADLKFRNSMRKFISRNGTKRLHEKLRKIDPAAAGSIHPNDARRIVRALEIYRATGRTMTDMKSRTRGLKDIYDIRIFALTGPRDKIYERIDTRVERMFEGPVLKEVGRLKSKAISRTAKAVLGFNEILMFLKGEHSLEAAKSLMKISTRHFAKRQLTWFRADKRIMWFDFSMLKDEAIIKVIAKEIRGK